MALERGGFLAGKEDDCYWVGQYGVVSFTTDWLGIKLAYSNHIALTSTHQYIGFLLPLHSIDNFGILIMGVEGGRIGLNGDP